MDEARDRAEKKIATTIGRTEVSFAAAIHEMGMSLRTAAAQLQQMTTAMERSLITAETFKAACQDMRMKLNPEPITRPPAKLL